MKNHFRVLISSLAFIVWACTPEGEIRVNTNAVTNILQNSATSGLSVSMTGNYTIGACGVCYSTESYPTLDDPHTIDGYGVGTFSTTLSNLSSDTIYYIRAYANTSSGIIYGYQEMFRTKDDITLSYGSGNYKNSWGLTNGGLDEWAVMFPSSMLTKYEGMKVLRVKVYSDSSRSVTLRIYRGGTTSPTYTIHTSYVFLSKGWNKLEVSPFTLNTYQNLWVSLGCTYSAGEYPSASSSGINNKNARWKNNNGNWYDVYDTNGNVDLCWMIQVQLGNDTKSVSLSYDQPAEEIGEKCVPAPDNTAPEFPLPEISCSDL